MKIDLSEDELKYIVRCLVMNYADDVFDFNHHDVSDRGMNAKVLGKLVGPNHFLDDTYSQARKNKTLEHDINQSLFLGAGYHSIVASNQLHKRLQFAIYELGGIQQNGGMGTEFDTQMDEECHANIEQVIKDIVIAFGYEPKDFNL